MVGGSPAIRVDILHLEGNHIEPEDKKQPQSKAIICAVLRQKKAPAGWQGPYSHIENYCFLLDAIHVAGVKSISLPRLTPAGIDRLSSGSCSGSSGFCDKYIIASVFFKDVSRDDIVHRIQFILNNNSVLNILLGLVF